VKTWIALFRGINVGGSQVLPMKRLVQLLEGTGCREVRTYIQSGNAVLRSPLADGARLAARIRAAVAAGCGFEPQVIVVNHSKLQRAAAANPFPEASANPKTVHLFFLAERPKKPNLESLNRVKTATESFVLKGDVFYLHTPDGLGKSRLAARIERDLGVAATARNWRTVSMLMELASFHRPGAN
jgi:uncharacterized protein (DUF1697 family)